ncbi:MAG TPA: hypothetical protein VEJ18_06610 [Planctomycetota bacterium]|nr:hypothetical protein [Planctomycetota bacterium]
MLDALILAFYLQGTAAEDDFETRLRRATGPSQLRDLEAWCAKSKRAEERKRVQQLLAKASLPAKPAADFRAREAARANGDAARQAVSEFREARAKAVAEEIRKIAAWMSEEKYAPAEARERLQALVTALLSEEPDERKVLEGEIQAVVNAPEATDPSKKAEFDSRIKAVLRKFTTQIFSAVEKCLAAGEPGYAFDLYRFLLAVDPDNERAHKGLGETRVDGRWLRPFEVEQHRAGLGWDPVWGFVPHKGRDRYEKGEVFDLTSKQWGKPADLNKLHADPANPWKLESEHFLLISTADLSVNVKLLARMEAFFLQAFRQYDLFFAGKNPSKSAGLIFGMAPTKKRLKVYYYRDQAQFRQHAKPPTAWAAGFYSGGAGASYFYGEGERIPVLVMQHELTHQILGEYSDGGSGGGPWLAEGAAVYLEDADFRNGTLSLGDLKDNHRVSDYRRRLRNKEKEHSLSYLLSTFGPGGNWDQGDISKNYRGAGAAMYFLMTFDGGRYRADTIQLLRDAYFAKPRPLDEYYGLSIAGLDFLMERFYRECDVE